MFHVETISIGHAKGLLAIKTQEEQIKIAEYIIENNLSVRGNREVCTSLYQGKGRREEKEKERKKNIVKEP